MGSLAVGVAYVVVYAAAVMALRHQTLAATLVGHAGLLLPPLAFCWLVLRRRHEWRGCQRLFWATVAIGAALWVVGHLGWTYASLTTSRSPWLGWHTVFTLCGGIAPLIALVARPYLGVRAHALSSVGLGLGSFGLLAVFLYAYFVLVPSLLFSETEAQAALLALIQVDRGLLLAALLLTLAAAWRTPWRRVVLYLAVAAALGFVLRAAMSMAIADGGYAVGTLYDLAWIAPWVGWWMAAAEAPASPAVDARTDPSSFLLPVTASAIPVFLIPLIGYSVLNLQPLDSAVDAFRALLTGVMTVAGLGLLTLRLASQGTELQRADARLRLLAAATAQTADLILITRANGSVEHANDAFVRALGYSRAELERLRFAALIDPAFAGAAAQIEKEVEARGIWRGTLLRRRKDGSMFPAACTVVALRSETGDLTHYVGVERDISDEIRLREQLVHSERLSAIGELVAGVAHEINNPLQTIIGSVELMMEERPGDAGRRDLEIVRREATRAGQIVRNLLSFVRRGASDRAPADLNAIVGATVDLREFHLQQRNIRLDVQLATEPLEVVVNREEIQQIVLNLLLNAEHAVLDAAAEGTISFRTLRQDGMQALEISDTGPGIPAELRGRIFEPFFTTKEVGQGTGLGLSISHGIAAAHGGTLELRPSGQGACFRLALPAAASGVRRPRSTVEVVDGRPVALVVDDELPIRRLVVRLLDRRGYQVLEAETGEAALELAIGTSPDLVLCDVRMPGMTGPELYRALAREGRLPDRFVFITGDRAAVRASEPAVAYVPVLAKPFTAADLDAVLDSTPSRPSSAY
jgi:PAS domain S-box-containing protein